MDIRIVEEDEIFKETVERYLDLKSAKNSIDEELDKCLEEFQSYAGVDLKSDFEGKVNLISGKTKVELEFKFKNGTTLEKTIYKMYKGSADNSFVIKYTIDGTTDTINVVRTATGYTFTYSNDYFEEVKA